MSTLLSRSAGVDPGSLRPGQIEELAWALAVSLPLCVRRRFPLTALTICAAAFVGLQLNGLSAEHDTGPLPVPTAFGLFAIGTNVLFAVGAWLTGNATWVQMRQRAELAERNRELKIERTRTRATRHANASTADVMLSFTATSVELLVADNGRPAVDPWR